MQVRLTFPQSLYISGMLTFGQQTDGFAFSDGRTSAATPEGRRPQDLWKPARLKVRVFPVALRQDSQGWQHSVTLLTASPLLRLSNPANNHSMEVRSGHLESVKSHFFDTSSWGSFCDVTPSLKQARQSDGGLWIKTDDYPCRQAFRHFMNLLNRAVYGAAFRRHGKRLRVLPVLEKGEARLVDGIFIVQLSCPRTWMLLPLKN
jgi:hypothetical protein